MQNTNTNAGLGNTAADKMALLQQLLAETGFAMPQPNQSPAQQVAAQAPNGAPGLATGVAGQPSTVALWQYATSSVVAGRAYRTNAAGLHNSLKGLALNATAAANKAAALGTATPQHFAPATYQAVAQAVNVVGGRCTTDAAWCGTRDLVDLGLAMPVQVGQRKLVALTAAGMAHLTAIVTASQQHGQPVWVCTYSGAIVACNRANTVLAESQAAQTEQQPETQPQAPAETEAASQPQAAAESQAPASPKPAKPGKGGKAAK